jgi:hypothetical protein
MKAYWFLLVGIFLLIMALWLKITESFANTEEIDPALVTSYENFATFYNAFMPNWEQAIATTKSLNDPLPDQPIAKTPQDLPPPPSTPPMPSQQEMNAFIDTLVKEEKKPFPYVTKPFPKTITKATFDEIETRIMFAIPPLKGTNKTPLVPPPFINALTWMNTNIAESHKSLGAALKGGNIQEGFLLAEAFVDATVTNTCQQVTKCTQAQDLQQQQQQQAEQKKKADALRTVTDSFTIGATGDKIAKLMKENAKLVATSKKIQNQAQSGELLNQFNPPTTASTSSPVTKYPPIQMKEINYGDYKYNATPSDGQPQDDAASMRSMQRLGSSIPR